MQMDTHRQKDENEDGINKTFYTEARIVLLLISFTKAQTVEFGMGKKIF